MSPKSEKSINTLMKLMDEGDELRKYIRPKEARWREERDF